MMRRLFAWLLAVPILRRPEAHLLVELAVRVERGAPLPREIRPGVSVWWVQLRNHTDVRRWAAALHFAPRIDVERDPSWPDPQGWRYVQRGKLAGLDVVLWAWVSPHMPVPIMPEPVWPPADPVHRMVIDPNSGEPT